jgi:salicylate hydroxylase
MTILSSAFRRLSHRQSHPKPLAPLRLLAPSEAIIRRFHSDHSKHYAYSPTNGSSNEDKDSDSLVPEKLRRYLSWKVTNALKHYSTEPSQTPISDLMDQYAARTIDSLISKLLLSHQSDSSALRRNITTQTEEIASALVQYKYSINRNCTLAELVSGQVALDEILSNCFAYRQKNAVFYHDIVSHHKNLKTDQSLLGNSSSVDQILDDPSSGFSRYADAAEHMGSKVWVKEGNEWMSNYAYNFFCRNGARKAYINKQLEFNLTQEKSVSKDSYQRSKLARYSAEEIGRDLASNILAPDEQIRLLDVGSCYNPLISMPNSQQFNVTAIDLYPKSSSVLQCDFLNLRIGPADSMPIIENGVLKQLPAGSFDVVTMSLVLSYLPTPELRLQMIKKARELLVSPGYNGYPHRAGILLLVEKTSIFHMKNNLTEHSYASMIHAWKQGIQATGYDILHYKQLHSTNPANRHNPSHVFAFKTSETRSEDNPKHRLWIRQDFDVEAQKPFLSSKATIQTMSQPIIKEKKHRPFVAIIGGGIGGTALGLSLQQRNIPVKIFERDSSFDARKQGYALTMQQATTTLRSLGLRGEISNIGVRSFAHQSLRWDSETIGCYGPLVRNGLILDDKQTNWPATREMVDDSSQQRINVEYYTNTLLQKTLNRHNIHIPRQRVREILLNDIHPDNIYWKKRLVSYQEVQDYHQVKLTFDGDEEEVMADVVVAADGIYSSIRKQMFSLTSNHDLNYLGLMVILGISPIDAHPALASITSLIATGKRFRKQVQWVDGSTRVFTMPYDDSRIMWQLSFPIDESTAQMIAGQGSIALKEQAIKLCQHWDVRLKHLIESTEHENISGHPAYDRDPITMEELANHRDPRSRVTMLGDSAHPMSPFKGQGANQALVDALELSNAITASNLVSADRQEISSALRLYEQNMLRRSSEKVLKSRRSAIYLHSSAALAEGNITRAMAAEMAEGV